MKTNLKDRLKKVRGTYKITQKELVTPRYLQLVLKGADISEFESLKVGVKVRIRPENANKEHKHAHREGAKFKSHFIITHIDAESKSITVETLSAFENDPLIEKLMDEQTQSVRLKSKGSKHEKHGKLKHKKHHHAHHGKHNHHHEAKYGHESVPCHHRKDDKLKKKHHAHHGDHSCGHHRKHKHAHHHHHQA